MDLLAQSMPLAFSLWVFVLGAVVGSFLNVVIARVPAGESLVSPGSRCPRCKEPIRWYDNVPIVSWIALRAKCRHCSLPISARYPTVELLVALIAVGIARQLGPSLTAVGYFVFAACLVALAYIDLDTWLLPEVITFPLLALGVNSPFWNKTLTFPESLIGADVGFMLFAAIALFGEKVLKREVMGWGDVWLLGGIGAWLGWQSLLPVILLSAVQGAVVGGILLAVGKGEKGPPPVVEPPPDPISPPSEEDWVPPKNAVPYGPFLALAALEYLFAGGRLVDGWNHLLMRILG
jgi:leader peptidase (prepilin peptidase)/N-methyltransferase